VEVRPVGRAQTKCRRANDLAQPFSVFRQLIPRDRLDTDSIAIGLRIIIA
jgi:hypothetical protein